MSDIIFIHIVTCTILYILSTQSMKLVIYTYLLFIVFYFDPGLTITVNFIFTLREPNVYKPHGFLSGSLANLICFCVTVLFYRYLYFVVKKRNIRLSKIQNLPFCRHQAHKKPYTYIRLLTYSWIYHGSFGTIVFWISGLWASTIEFIEILTIILCFWALGKVFK